MRGARGLLYAMLLLPPLLLSGCWGQRQISDLVVVMGAGIDVLAAEQGEEEQILLTVELARLKEQGSEGEPVLLSASGPTVLAAVRNLAQSLDKQLHWGHMQLLLIGESAARRGLDRYLSLFHNHWQMSPHIYLVLCEGEAREALALPAGISGYAAGGLHDMLAKQKDSGNGYVRALSLQGYMSAHTLPHSGLIAPLVSIKEPLPGTTAVDDGPAAGALYFKGMAVLDEHSRYAGQLAGVENTGAALILNQARDFALVIEQPLSRQKMSLELVSWRVKRSWELDAHTGRIKLRLNGQAQARMGDEQKAQHYNDQAAVEQLEQLLSLELQRQIEAAWARAIQLNVDFLELGMDLYRYHPQEWEKLEQEWPQAMRQLELVVDIQSKVDLAGQSR